MKNLSFTTTLFRTLAIFVLLAGFGGISYGATFTVTKTADTNDGVCDADCSLREAVAAATATPANDAIEFDSVIFNAPQIIILSGNSGLDISSSGGSLTVNGSDARKLTIDCCTAERHFNLLGNSVVTINNVTLSGRRALGFGGGISVLFATLTLNNSVLVKNSAQHGGAINNGHGTVYINNSTISENFTSDSGGGIQNSGGAVDITNSTISNNLATQNGGGIYNINGGTINLENSTIAGNSLMYGKGGGVYNNPNMDAINVHNTIIADNTGPNDPDFSGNFISKGYNLLENSRGAVISGVTVGNILGQDPKLSPLTDNGSFTPTQALMIGSPSIDAADPSTPVTADQRGIFRPADGDGNGVTRSDIGAFELRALFVTNNNDAGTGSLRQSLLDVVGIGDAIGFAGSAFNVPQVIVLTSGQLVVAPNSNFAISGAGADRLTISGNNQSRVFSVGNGSHITISGMTISSGNGIGQTSSGNGGGILSSDNTKLTLRDSVVTGNSASGNGGGIAVLNTELTLVATSISNNSAGNSGGGISALNNQTGSLNFTASSLNNNTSSNSGGGIYNTSSLKALNFTVTGNSSLSGVGGGIYNDFNSVATIDKSIISGNRSSTGGGIYNQQEVTITNSTLSGNAVPDTGGGIYNRGLAALINTTVSSNSAGAGGGIFNDSDLTLSLTGVTIANNSAVNSAGGVYNGTSGRVTARNSIFADNRAGTHSPDFAFTLTSQGYNLIENAGDSLTITGTTTGNILGQDPKLFPLGNYGGATPTHALRLNSPAIDKGISSAIGLDQRGLSRPYDYPVIPNASGGNGADIGAFERQPNDLVNPRTFDFDGDGKADISVFRPSNGAWYLQQSTNGFTGVQFGLNGDSITPADFDGDGKTDLAVYRSGVWYLQRSSQGFTGISFGAAGDIPMPADFDGDGRADLAVFRPSTGAWYVQGSTIGFYGTQFGQNGDRPVAADYDGDGKADIAVYRNGVWYLNRSQLGFTGISFGNASDLTVPADYDGDGKTDVAVFRPSEGAWYLQQSTAGFTGTRFGQSGDAPAPADYDGDGKADLGVFRNGVWYLQRSTAGFTGVSFGSTGDKPVPNAFVQ